MAVKLTDGFRQRLEREVAARIVEGRLPDAWRRVLAGEVPTQPLGREPPQPDRMSPGLRTVVRIIGRPSLLIRDDTFEEAVSDEWSEVLEAHRGVLESALPGVGRIDLEHHPDLAWAGTGFLIDDDIVVTNRHVAHEFVAREGSGFTWRSSGGVEIGRSVDFRAEHAATGSASAELTEILWVERESGPDMAFFRIAGTTT